MAASPSLCLGPVLQCDLLPRWIPETRGSCNGPMPGPALEGSLSSREDSPEIIVKPCENGAVGAQSREAIGGSFQEEVALEMRSGTFQVVPGGRVGRAVLVEGAAGAKARRPQSRQDRALGILTLPRTIPLPGDTGGPRRLTPPVPHAGRESVPDSSSLILRGPLGPGLPQRHGWGREGK